MKKTANKAILFIKRNSVYIVLALCIIAVALSVTLMFLNENIAPQPEIQNPIDDEQAQVPDKPVDSPVFPDEPDQPVDSVITFIMPVANTTAIEEYSSTMVFNVTLNRYEAHMAMDFFATEGTEVLSVYKGTVESVENTLLKGYTVTIDHGNGLKTVYNSLADGDSVSVGQTVNAGDVIGHVSTSNRQEYKEGAHLHFEVIENGAVIDPSKYLILEEK